MATTAEDWTYIKTLTAITAAGNIPIDLNAQTIGNLAVDIAAAAVGNMPININEQGLGDVTMNINAQDLTRVIIRNSDGGTESSDNEEVDVGPGATGTIHSYSGSGSLRYVVFRTHADVDSQLIRGQIWIDGTMLYPYWPVSELNSYGFNASSRPISVLKYAVDGNNVWIWYFEKGIVFDSSLVIKAFNGSGAQTVTVDAHWFYQALT